MSSNAITQLYDQVGPSEGMAEHAALALDQGFSFCTVLGKLLYVYIT
jgi:hypothetical protein